MKKWETYMLKKRHEDIRDMLKKETRRNERHVKKRDMTKYEICWKKIHEEMKDILK